MPTLVILAAGLGTRFGGDKQTTRLGPGGALLMEYGMYDAISVGFRRIVIIVRPEMVDDVQHSLAMRIRARASVACVAQALTDLPPGHAPLGSRTKPWGTAHAVLAARRVVTEPFVVANADDLYGRASYEVLARSLAEPPTPGPASYSLVGFPLRNTLSAAGPVNRALCRTDDDGMLERIEERTGLTAATVDAQRIGGTLVSMNLWGFTPAVFGQLEESFAHFLATNAGDNSAEFLLPTVVQSLVAMRMARVRVLPTTGAWCGVTYAADAPIVTAQLEALTARGEYPTDLWA